MPEMFKYRIQIKVSLLALQAGVECGANYHLAKHFKVTEKATAANINFRCFAAVEQPTTMYDQR